jgi:monovalent cation/proton antiporter MnhG/PhaG subunit
VKAVVVDVLLGLGVLSILFSVLGVVVMRDALDRLHFTAPAALFAPVLFAVAVLVEEPFSSAGVKAVLVALVSVVTTPVLSHATARAARIRDEGGWKVHAHELEHPEEYR